MDKLELSQSIVCESPKDDATTCWSFVRYVTKLFSLSWIVSATMELPDYTIQVKRGENDATVTYLDKSGFPLFVAEKSKKDIYKSLVSLFD